MDLLIPLFRKEIKLFLRFIVILFILYVAFDSNREIEHGCFKPFTSKVNQFFSSMTENQGVHIWVIEGDGVDTPFLLKNGMTGHISPENSHLNSNELVNPDADIRFTGRVYKRWPDWGSRLLANSKKSFMVEVTLDYKQYLIFDMDIPDNLRKQFANHCKF